MCGMQAVLHDFVGRAAAVAGSLVHVGQSIPRAANLAEAIMDPADVVSTGLVCCKRA
jgi:hypothetical protein